jgi:hypothetical protein
MGSYADSKSESGAGWVAALDKTPAKPASCGEG